MHAEYIQYQCQFGCSAGFSRIQDRWWSFGRDLKYATAPRSILESGGHSQIDIENSLVTRFNTTSTIEITVSGNMALTLEATLRLRGNTALVTSGWTGLCTVDPFNVIGSVTLSGVATNYSIEAGGVTAGVPAPTEEILT